MITQDRTILRFERGDLNKDKLLALYRGMLEPRMIEEKMLKLLRQGKVSKWFAGIGQEAIAVGAAHALDPDELIFTMHRNLGVFTTRKIPLERLFAQWQGKASGFTKGRDRSFHFGAPDYGIVGMISHLGPQLSLANGVGLAHLLKREQKVALAFTGEGGTSQGEFHEALNVAAVWQLPVIFLIENNGYGLSTPIAEQYQCTTLADRGTGYGMEAMTIQGNNVLEVYRTVKRVAREIREKPHPVLIECMTFRMRGHEEASGTKYVPQALMDYWAARDPVSNYADFLLEEGILNDALISEYRGAIQKKIDTAWSAAEGEPAVDPDPIQELEDVYRTYPFTVTEPSGGHSELRFVDAIKDGLDQAMDKYPDLVCMGQDIAGYGGVFKVTEGLVEKYGAARVRNTPLCESSILGAALGLSIRGMKSMVEMQFADFVTCGFNQIVNNIAKVHYRWGQNADVVIRMPTGAGVNAGPFHSQSNEAWFYHVPGLKIFYPSTPFDAKGLLLAAFEDPNPVLFFEHKKIYRNIRGEVPQGYYTVDPGKANVVRKGELASIITYGMGVHWASDHVEKHGLDVEILDLRCLLPMDYEAIRETVRKTGKVLILHEDTVTGGIGADIAAYISERLFAYLDGPVIRVASMDTPVPFAESLENQFLPVLRFAKKLDDLLNY